MSAFFISFHIVVRVTESNLWSLLKMVCKKKWLLVRFISDSLMFYLFLRVHTHTRLAEEKKNDNMLFGLRWKKKKWQYSIFRSQCFKKDFTRRNYNMTLSNGYKIFDLADGKKWQYSRKKKNDNMSTYCHFFPHRLWYCHFFSAWNIVISFPSGRRFFFFLVRVRLL